MSEAECVRRADCVMSVVGPGRVCSEAQVDTESNVYKYIKTKKQTNKPPTNHRQQPQNKHTYVKNKTTPAATAVNCVRRSAPDGKLTNVRNKKNVVYMNLYTRSRDN